MALESAGPDPLSAYSSDDLEWAYRKFHATYPPQEDHALNIVYLEIPPHRRQLLLDVARYSSSHRIILHSDAPTDLAIAAAENVSVLELAVHMFSVPDGLKDAVTAFARRQETKLALYFCREWLKPLTATAGSDLVELFICGHLDEKLSEVLELAGVLGSLHQLRSLTISLTGSGKGSLDADTVVRLALAATSSQYLRTLSMCGLVLIPVVSYLYAHVIPINNTIKYFRTSFQSDPEHYRRILGSNWSLNRVSTTSGRDVDFEADWGRKRVRSFVSAAAATAVRAAAEASPAAESSPAAEILVRSLPEMFAGRPDRNLATRILCAYHRAAYARQHKN